MTEEQIIYLILTTGFAFLIGAYFNIKHADYIPPKAMLETFRLLKFSEDNLNQPYLQEKLPKFLLDQTALDPKETKLKRFFEKYQAFKSKTILDYNDVDIEGGKKDNWFEMLLKATFMGVILVFLAPVASVLSAYAMVKEKIHGEPVSTLIHPLDRYNISMQIIGMLASLFIAFVVSAYLFEDWITLIFLVVFLEVLLLIKYFIRLIFRQMQWKEQWGEILDIIMQKASQEDNYDIHNTALLLKKNVEKYPDIPISQIQKAAVLAWAALEFIVPSIVKMLE